MRKDTLRAPKAEKVRRPTFTACGREENGGAQAPGNGTTCGDGLLFFLGKLWRKTRALRQRLRMQEGLERPSRSDSHGKGTEGLGMIHTRAIERERRDLA